MIHSTQDVCVARAVCGVYVCVGVRACVCVWWVCVSEWVDGWVPLDSKRMHLRVVALVVGEILQFSKRVDVRLVEIHLEHKASTRGARAVSHVDSRIREPETKRETKRES